MSLVLLRNYSQRDLQPAFKSIALHPINVVVMVDAPAHVPSEYDVMVCDATADANFMTTNEVTMADPNTCQRLPKGQPYVVTSPTWDDRGYTR